jgi:hypothetical protein
LKCIRLFAGIIFIHLSTSCVQAISYSDNLDDILACFPYLGHVPAGCHAPTPIGDLGPIETVVDLRGFVPMSFASKSGISISNQLHGAASDYRKLLVNTDGLHWYKIPTKKALLMLYYGDLDSTNLAADTTDLEQRFSSTTFMKESEAQGDVAAWCRLAYAAARDAEPIFKSIAGGSGSEGAEPVTLFFTDQSCFVLLSFRYSSLVMENQGQLLVAMEFSRSLKEYKTYYPLYSTLLWSKSTKDLAGLTASCMGQALHDAAIVATDAASAAAVIGAP